MSILFIDTNIFLRHLLNDSATTSRRCLALFQSIEQGRQVARTSDLVVSELVYVLSSKVIYNLSRDEIRTRLLPLLMLPNLRLAHKRLYPRVFELYTGLPIDYVDCYHAALLEREDDARIYSYDRHFDRVPGVERREP